MAQASVTTLRAWPSALKETLEKDDVAERLRQLVQERGHLRNVTERALQDEVDAGTADSEDAKEDTVQKEQILRASVTERREEIDQAKGEMIRKLETIHFAAGNAMNLINLVLSRDPTKNLEAAYTPLFHTTNVPRGSFDISTGTVVEDPTRRAFESRKQELVAKGSRMEALDWAADNLLNAAARLENEIGKETTYWDEVLSISDQGWSLQRSRHDAKNAAFSVRYGLSEASDSFKARGTAPLRMDKTGGIVLDQSLSAKPKALRVRICEHGETIGSSQMTLDAELSSLGIEQSIKLARESLREEELFHELLLETRQLPGYDVRLRSSVIAMNLAKLDHFGPGHELLIDCVPREIRSDNQTSHREDWLADTVADGLRLLLAHEHHVRLYNRSQLPDPMTRSQRQSTSPPLLRVLLALFIHLDAVNILHSHLLESVKTLKSAGLQVEVESVTETSWANLVETTTFVTRGGISATDQVVSAFGRPYEACATVIMPSVDGAKAEKMAIYTRTFVGPPHYGAEHRAMLPASLIEILHLETGQGHDVKFSSPGEVTSYFDWVLSLHLSHSLVFNNYSGRSVIRSREPQVCILTRKTANQSIKEDDISIELKGGVLKVTATSNGQLATGAVAESFTWNGADGRLPLLEKINSWLD